MKRYDESECAALRFELTAKTNEVEIADGEIERLRAERDAANKQAEIQAESLRNACADVERLRVHVFSLDCAHRAAGSRLAAATELLRDLHRELEDRGGSLTRKTWNRLETHVDSLAAQPAAPALMCPVCKTSPCIRIRGPLMCKP